MLRLLKGDDWRQAGHRIGIRDAQTDNHPNLASVCGPVQFQSGFTVSLGEW